MPTTMTAREAKEQLDALLNRPHDRFDAVIVEREGEPRAVIVSFLEYQQMRSLWEALRQEEVISELHRVSAEVAARNQDLTEEQIEELASRFSHDIFEDMVRDGRLRFAEP